MLATAATLAIAILVPCFLIAGPLPWRRGSRQPEGRSAWLPRATGSLPPSMRRRAMAGRHAASTRMPADAPPGTGTPTP